MAQYIKIWCVFLLGCQTLNLKKSANKIFHDLDDFKRITTYIIEHNYHNNFSKNDSYWLGKTADSTLMAFIQEKRVSSISIGTDSAISYSIGFKSILSKGKELYFYFSTNPPVESSKKNGVKKILLEKNIYYIEY